MDTGKWINVCVEGKNITVLNQRSRLWTHPYDDVTPQKATLSSAGCGVFSICHCGQWLTGKAFSAEELADFSVANGGRGDDGTDRPALLDAMMRKGLAERFGFRYEADGLRNDLDTLFRHLQNRRGTALCNLRVGHIVSLYGARTVNGERQALVIDSYSETLDERVMPWVREVNAESAVTCTRLNAAGVACGEQRAYAVYWAALDPVRDFNLLYAL